MLLNWCEEITNIDPSINFRATGGWVKTVTGLDKSVLNGFSLVGNSLRQETIRANFQMDYILTAIRKGRNPTQNRTLGYSD